MAQYAIRGYEVNAIDFMVKPVSYYNFADKVRKAILFAGRREEREILLSHEDGMLRLSVSDIQYIEKDKNYLVYHTNQGILKSRGTMAEMKKTLETSSFSECTSGCLVNLKYVCRITKDSVFVNGEELSGRDVDACGESDVSFGYFIAGTVNNFAAKLLRPLAANGVAA